MNYIHLTIHDAPTRISLATSAHPDAINRILDIDEPAELTFDAETLELLEHRTGLR
jgi:hypothetical protein